MAQLSSLGDIESMKILRAILIACAAVLLWALPPPAESAASKPLAVATSAYRDNPSPENKAKLDHVREVRGSRQLKHVAFIASLLAADFVALYFISRQIHRHDVA